MRRMTISVVYAPGTKSTAAATIRTFAAVLPRSTARAASMQIAPSAHMTGPM